ncbi:MAG: YdcF family protein [Actinomycetia bacterium]|nr:YdcF family protein [Actinomycetes bacterium]
MSKRVTVAIYIAGLVSALVLSLGLVAMISAYRVVRPRTVSPDQVDAVVVLAGSGGERARTALALIDDGVAPVLVINAGNQDWGVGWEELAPLCQEAQQTQADGGGSERLGPEVICVTVSPDNTAGEAQTISALATERGWQSLALVTSDYHLHRATIRFERCFAGEIVPVSAPSAIGRSVYIDEWFATMHAILVDRSCDQPTSNPPAG